MNFGSQVIITLLNGTAEIFGTELAIGHEYKLGGCKLAIFSWHGCQLETKGPFEVVYISDETPMVSYLNTHLTLEWLRYQASQQQSSDTTSTSSSGPKVMICGPVDVGKSTISRILLTYAIRHGHYPIFVDLDMGQGALCVPGALAAVVPDRPIDIEEGYSNLDPLAYFYGHASLSENPKVFRKCMNQLALTIRHRCVEDRRANVAGLIVNWCGWVEELGYELLLTAVDQFAIDILLVVGHERLYIDLVREFKSRSNLYIAKLSKSGGVVTRSQAYRRDYRSKRIRDYFYGASNQLCPYALTVNFQDVSVFKFGEGPIAPSSALPIGADRKVDETRPVKMNPGGHLLHSILAVSSYEARVPSSGKSSLSTTSAAVSGSLIGGRNRISIRIFF